MLVNHLKEKKGAHKMPHKVYANRAIELLQLLQQVLEVGNLENADVAAKKDKEKHGNQPPQGANQSVHSFPDSPLSFKGRV